MSTSKIMQPFGTWSSPFTAATLAEAKRLGDVLWDTEGETLLWLEGRSDKNVLTCRRGSHAPRDLTSDLNVRAEVGYGGGDFTVNNGVAFFAVAQGAKAGRIYRQSLTGGSARPITPAFGKASSPAVSSDGKWLVYIHSDEESNDRLAIVDTEGSSWPQILASGHDFYMQPRFSPDGRRVAFVAWDHPLMPWDGTQIWLADLVTPSKGLPLLENLRSVAGGDSIATAQPEFSPDSRSLYYLSDETGWTHLWLMDLSSNKKTQLTHGNAEYGLPAWHLGQRSYAVGGAGKAVYAVRNEKGFMQLQSIEPNSMSATTIQKLSAYTSATQLSCSPSGKLAFIGSSSFIPTRVVIWDAHAGEVEVAAHSSTETIESDAFSNPEPITHPTGPISGAGGKEVAHGLYYPPANSRFSSQGKPPLVVLVHGGPTSQVTAGWNPQTQFFTSRGFAVFQTNYRGSTGYGREYMLKLRGQWGILDVEDAIHAKRFLEKAGKVDPARSMIMGGSAGGYTVLQAMVEAPKEFTAGINLFGISNQFTATDTHKFESRYNDLLLGALPEAASEWRRRSPVFHAERISNPLAVFQGDIDEVVKKDQSDDIIEALRRNKTPYYYQVYAGEGHGWRKRETILHFYKEVERFSRQYVVFS